MSEKYSYLANEVKTDAIEFYTGPYAEGFHVDKEKAVKPNEQYPLCTGGENSCPPEDVGGIGGFSEYKEAMADVKHELCPYC